MMSLRLSSRTDSNLPQRPLVMEMTFATIRAGISKDRYERKTGT